MPIPLYGIRIRVVIEHYSATTTPRLCRGASPPRGNRTLLSHNYPVTLQRGFRDAAKRGVYLGKNNYPSTRWGDITIFSYA